MDITLSIDEKVVEKVRKIALDKDTTLTAMVREYLETVADSHMAERRERIRKLNETFRQYSGKWAIELGRERIFMNAKTFLDSNILIYAYGFWYIGYAIRENDQWRIACQP